MKVRVEFDSQSSESEFDVIEVHEQVDDLHSVVDVWMYAFLRLAKASSCGKAEIIAALINQECEDNLLEEITKALGPANSRDIGKCLLDQSAKIWPDKFE